MNKQFYIVLTFSFIFLIACKKSNKGSKTYSSERYYEEYDDGTYCAEIDYYNPNTGTQSTYTLPIEVEDEELVKINFSNGGWLDESHFIAPDISDGTASFEDDEGREFEVEILNEGDCRYTSYVEDEIEEEDNEDEVCPRCGNYKYSYDDYCDDCLLERQENEDDFYDY